MKYLYLFFVICCGLATAQALEVKHEHRYHIGNRYSFYSDVLGEEQTFSVALPESYQRAGDRQGYPIVFVLDGYEQQFRSVAAASYSSNFFGAKIPPAIVVAIPSNNRHRDYLPYHSNLDYFGKPSEKYAASGGGLKYRQYLREELFPLIEATYRSNGQRVLVGHSTGAHFALFDLLQSDRLFHSYIAIDPNLWMNDWYLGKLAEQAGDTVSSFTGSLYLSAAPRKEEPSRQEDELDKIVVGVQAIADRPDDSVLRWFPHENHQTILPPSYLEGLHHVFAGYEPPSIESVVLEPEALTVHFEKYSARMGAVYLADPNYVNIAAHQALNHYRDLGKALELYRMNVELYPKRAWSWGALGYFYASTDKPMLAIEAYKTAQTLKPDDQFYARRISELQELIQD